MRNLRLPEIDFLLRLGDNPNKAVRRLKEGLMSLSPNTPADPEQLDAASLPRWVILLFVVAFGFVGYLFYANYSDRQAARISQR